MAHPFEEFQRIDHGSLREREVRVFIIDQLNYIWDANWDLGTFTVDELLNRMKKKPAPEDIETAKKVLELLIESFNDDHTVPIIVSDLMENSHSYLEVVISGWFGIKAQAAVPALITEVAGHFPVKARQSLKRIGIKNQKVLFKMLRLCVRERYFLGFAELLALVEEQYPYAIKDQEFWVILHQASESTNIEVRGFLLDFIERQDINTKRYFQLLVEKLVDHHNNATREQAVKILQMILDV